MLTACPEEFRPVGLTEERKHSVTLERITLDRGDLTTYTGQNGKRYLRVWQHVGRPLWFEVSSAASSPEVK